MPTSRRMHFISGLPRSGSTLLAAILRQNPSIHAGMSSPVGSLMNGMLSQLGAGSEWGPVVGKAQRRRLLRGLFDAYYAEQADKPIIFDTNRLWCAKLPAVVDLFPEAKVIACVRNVGWIMDSIERLYRSNPYENTRLFHNDTERSTVYSRVDTLAQRDRMVGFAWSALKEAFYGEHASKMLVVDYDMLVRSPARVLPLIYQFIEEHPFVHDFENVEYDAPDFDEALGVTGLHKVRPQVGFKERRTVLPPDLFQKYAELSFWKDPTGSAANLITAVPKE